MKKYIYTITNTINNKIYVGQTNDPRRREREHFALGYVDPKIEQKVLYQAMQKYGIENFIFTIIEGPIENYNEREQFWIEHYNSLVPNGYNMTSGGDAPPTLKGEAHPLCSHNREIIEQIQQLLSTTDQSTEEIAQKFNYNPSSINRINLGQLWYNENLTYPLRLEHTKQFQEERKNNIIQDLLHTSLTQKEIAAKYGVSRTTVTAINNGSNFYSDNIIYPIRTQDQHSRPIAMLDRKTKKVVQEFSSAGEAEKVLQLPIRAASNIRGCASGKIHTAYGYIWKYI